MYSEIFKYYINQTKIEEIKKNNQNNACIELCLLATPNKLVHNVCYSCVLFVVTA